MRPRPGMRISVPAGPDGCAAAPGATVAAPGGVLPGAGVALFSWNASAAELTSPSAAPTMKQLIDLMTFTTPQSYGLALHWLRLSILTSMFPTQLRSAERFPTELLSIGHVADQLHPGEHIAAARRLTASAFPRIDGELLGRSSLHDTNRHTATPAHIGAAGARRSVANVRRRISLTDAAGVWTSSTVRRRRRRGEHLFRPIMAPGPLARLATLR